MKVSDRPRLDLPLGTAERLFESVALAGMLATVVYAVMHWNYLPERIPSHFNFQGEPDGWSGKWFVWLLPGMSVLLYMLMSVASRYPHTFNYPWPITAEKAERQYLLARWMMLALKVDVTWMFAFMEYHMIRTAYGEAPGLGPWLVPVALVACFGTVIVYFVLAARAK